MFGLIKSYITVLKHIFRKPVTLEYPEVKNEFNDRFKGKLALRKEMCIGCGTCQRVCPCFDVIKIEKEKTEKGFIIKSFDADFSKCIFCGNCVNTCPKGALYMEKVYELAVDDKKKLNVNLGEN